MKIDECQDRLVNTNWDTSGMGLDHQLIDCLELCIIVDPYSLRLNVGHVD